jgi:hypothetical protein
MLSKQRLPDVGYDAWQALTPFGCHDVRAVCFPLQRICDPLCIDSLDAFGCSANHLVKAVFCWIL